MSCSRGMSGPAGRAGPPNAGSGSGEDEGYGIAVREGRAYVTGFTNSADYPTTPGAFDTTFNGGADAFVTKLPTG